MALLNLPLVGWFGGFLLLDHRNLLLSSNDEKFNYYSLQDPKLIVTLKPTVYSHIHTVVL